MIMSIVLEKKIWQNLTTTSFKKPLNKTGIKQTCLNMVKAIYDTSTVNIILTNEMVKTLLLRSEIRQGYTLYHFYLTLYRKYLIQSDKRRK